MCYKTQIPHGIAIFLQNKAIIRPKDWSKCTLLEITSVVLPPPPPLQKKKEPVVVRGLGW